MLLRKFFLVSLGQKVRSYKRQFRGFIGQNRVDLISFIVHELTRRISLTSLSNNVFSNINLIDGMLL